MLSVDDWEKLSMSWTAKPIEWQCRFANLLDGVEAKYGVPILIAMLVSMENDVVSSAIDSLDGLDNSLERYAHLVKADAIARLEEIKNLTSVRLKIEQDQLVSA